jgi:hypothetical protein
MVAVTLHDSKLIQNSPEDLLDDIFWNNILGIAKRN